MSKTAIAISGGIDSLMAAYFLKKRGEEVVGIHFITGFENEQSPDHTISHIRNQLDIPIKVIDLKSEFHSKVVAHFVQSYTSGLTPNPCLVCNPTIKFGTVLSYAKKLGASSLATGHYARIAKDNLGNFHLLKGVDQHKDQSYFLSFLAQNQLAHARFPLGDLTKKEVIKIALENGLSSVATGESQDICFIKGTNYSEFLSRQPRFLSKPGNIEDKNGNILGKHEGLHQFTVGQRRGINCPAKEPFYVIRIDMEQNRLIVGFKQDLLVQSCSAGSVNWINRVPSSKVDVLTQIRYRHNATESTIIPLEDNRVKIRFNTPQSAVTPGQGAVFYKEDEVIGAGIIEK